MASPHAHAEGAHAGQDAEGKPLLPLGGAAADVEASAAGGDDGKPNYAWAASAFYRCLTLDSEALLASREALRSAAEVWPAALCPAGRGRGRSGRGRLPLDAAAARRGACVWAGAAALPAPLRALAT